MKLRNKKTGEIDEFLFEVIKDRIDLYRRVEHSETKNIWHYNSLAELNEEWEDAPEEPKEYWYIDWNGEVCRSDIHDERTEQMKLIGNYFESKEEAEKAVEKLKAWKRLKDKGFRFEYYDYSDRDLHNHIQIKAITNREVEDSMLCKEDLDLLFGGEE